MPHRAHVSALWRYPMKSAAGTALATMEIEPRGPHHDRRWMAVDESGRFVTARLLAPMVRLRADVVARGVRLSMPGGEAIEIDTPAVDAERISISVWKDTVSALRAGDAADRWLSAALGQPLRLVYMDAQTRRAVDPTYAQPGDEVSFADGYPLLAISQAALDDLNARLAESGRAPMTMLRFRPNLEIAGVAAHAEDAWRRVRIGEIEFDAVKPCTRCVFTTVDPDTGERDTDGEPLRTLKDYRRTPNGITFGMNLIPRGTGTLRVGDAVVPLD
ncbi:MAG: MOSC domain-containing protein [Xanthomonadaceae bacterium]|nr:MOSC domain-containing protein [Xanthomonadaceae bacterium]